MLTIDVHIYINLVMIQINQINKGVKMKLHHTKYKENYKKYILSTIETGIDDEPLKTDEEKIK